MSNIFTSLSQLERDYDALIAKIKEIIPYLTTDWTDFSDSDLGMFLVKMFVAMKDMQSYHFDQQALEAYLPTVKERANLISLLKLINYTLSSYKCSKVTVKNTGSSSISLTYGEVFQLEGASNVDRKWTYLGDTATIAPNGTFDVYQGYIKKWPVSSMGNTPFSSYADKNNKIVSSLVNGSYNLISLAISDANEKVAIDNTLVILKDGVKQTSWKEVLSFTNAVDSFSSNVSDTDPNLFRLYVDRDNKTYIEFYDIESLLPQTGVEINFMITEGADGNIPVGDTLYSENNDAVEVVAVSKGSNPETVEEARVNASSYVSTIDRAVTINDYMYLIKSWLKTNTRFASYPDYIVNALDYYKNINSSSPASAFPECPFKVANYVAVSDGTDITNILPDYKQKGVKKIDLLTATEEANLKEYLSSVRMAGIHPYVNKVPPSQVFEPSVSDVCPLVIKRFYVQCSYITVHSSILVDEDAISEALGEYYKLGNSSYGRSILINEVMRIILNTDPNIIINYIKLGYKEDEDGSGYPADFPSFDDNDLTFEENEIVAYGGIFFGENPPE